MEEKDYNEIHVDTDEISYFLFEKLVKMGYVPSEKEIPDLANIVFDYLVHKGVIKEEKK